MQVFTRLHDLPLSWHEQQDVGRLHARWCSTVSAWRRACSLVVLLQAIVVRVRSRSSR